MVAASEQPCAVRSGTGRRGRHAAFYAASRANAAICDRLEGCADYKLATYEQIEDYFRKLATAVPGRMKLVEMGKTTEGRVQVIEKRRVILLGFRTQHRGQSHRTCKLLFSAILLGGSLT